LDYPYLDFALYTIELSYAYNEEHMLSVLMHKNKLISHGGVTDFMFRGNAILEHAAMSMGIHEIAYDKIV